MSDQLQMLLTKDVAIKVSSTLDKSVGKKFLTDGNPETCWTSQQGTPQYIQIAFDKPVLPRRIVCTFQGGFVGTRCDVQIDWRTWTTIFPEDVNRSQDFDLPGEGVEGGVRAMKLVFTESSDFFGRITVYDLQVLGSFV
ncbi:hypothetical protein K474DRAFT_1683500 [Panus rudis PR-1116 ss-1]|nr:hypothetical protein K474DRAFT_1683500 [Panus rudis PR-1116 ss-1]